MSRIRSIHPGFKTDEDFVTVSRDARLFYLLLLGECDDQGIFEWKPTTLKMRIFPADNVDVAALLSELENIDALKSYEIEGRKLGAVRNFRKYQRPKSPNAIHLKPSDWGNYVGLTQDGGEPDPPSGGDDSADGGNVPAEEGGRRDGEGGEKKKPPKGGGGSYAFAGKIVKLNADNLDKWRKAYSAIPDIVAELTSLDAFYDKSLRGEDRENWFIRCGTALAKKHQEWVAKAAEKQQPAPIGRAWA